MEEKQTFKKSLSKKFSPAFSKKAEVEQKTKRGKEIEEMMDLIEGKKTKKKELKEIIPEKKIKKEAPKEKKNPEKEEISKAKEKPPFKKRQVAKTEKEIARQKEKAKEIPEVKEVELQSTKTYQGERDNEIEKAIGLLKKEDDRLKKDALTEKVNKLVDDTERELGKIQFTEKEITTKKEEKKGFFDKLKKIGKKSG